MAFLNKGRSIAVVKEVSYGADAPTFTDSDYIDYTTADISTDIEKIERTVMRNSMLKLESKLGQKTSSGSVAIEISGASAGIVNGHTFYKNGIGKEAAQAVTTTIATRTSATAFTVTSATGLSVGQVLKVEIASASEYTTIATLSGTSVTVFPALSGTPVALDDVQGLLTYTLPKPNDTVTSLAIRENLKPQSGSNVDYDYLGVMVSDVSLDFPVANIATASFSVAGASFTSDATGTTPTLPCTLATPVIGKNAILSVMGTSYAAQDVSIKIASEVTDTNAITTDGLSNKTAVGKTVTGSFKVQYSGVTNFDTFKDGTLGALKLLLRDGGKTSPIIAGVFAPSIKFTSVSRSDDGGILYDSIEFEVLSPDCGTTERALSVFFA